MKNTRTMGLHAKSRVIVAFLLFAVSSLASPAFAASAASTPTLEIQGDPQAGHATLSWSLPATESAIFQLQEAHSEDFSTPRVRYQGPHHSSVVSGLPDGTRFYRVKAQTAEDQPWSNWSAPQPFDVKHHGMQFAGTLFAVGALIFLSTLGFLLKMSAQKDECPER